MPPETDTRENKPPAELADALEELRSSTAKTAADKVLCHLAGQLWPVPEKPKPAPAPAPPAPAAN
jgi:hypothetical protein